MGKQGERKNVERECKIEVDEERRKGVRKERRREKEEGN